MRCEYCRSATHAKAGECPVKLNEKVGALFSNIRKLEHLEKKAVSLSIPLYAMEEAEKTLQTIKKMMKELGND